MTGLQNAMDLLKPRKSLRSFASGGRFSHLEIQPVAPPATKRPIRLRESSISGRQGLLESPAIRQEPTRWRCALLHHPRLTSPPSLPPPQHPARGEALMFCTASVRTIIPQHPSLCRHGWPAPGAVSGTGVLGGPCRSDGVPPGVPSIVVDVPSAPGSAHQLPV